jgi:hypothetical protein
MKELLIIVISVVFVFGLTTYASAAVKFDNGDALSRCGQKVVELGQEIEKCEDSKADTVAIGVAVGAFIGSGGLTAFVPVVGGVLGLPFILLGF